MGDKEPKAERTGYSRYKKVKRKQLTDMKLKERKKEKEKERKNNRYKKVKNK